MVILTCGCLIGVIGFGPRSGLAFFLTPMSSAYGWGRDVFALALAIQMLLWGAAQPFAGAMADRFGAVPVLSVGAVLYALGLASMAYADTPAALHLTAGLIIGFGLAGASFTIVIGAFGKLMPPEWRWGLEGSFSPWFPGFTLYRAAPGRDWSAALSHLEHDLRAAAAQQ